MHAISSYHGNRSTNKQTHRVDYNTLHHSLAHSVKLRQYRQKITFHGSAKPKEISQQYTPTTHTEAVHCQGVLLGSSIPVSDH